MVHDKEKNTNKITAFDDRVELFNLRSQPPPPPPNGTELNRYTYSNNSFKWMTISDGEIKYAQLNGHSYVCLSK